jgi:hypothetical protein
MNREEYIALQLAIMEDSSCASDKALNELRAYQSKEVTK